MVTTRIPRDVPILIVDDSPAIRGRVEVYLQDLGFKDVRTAESVTKGLETFRERPAPLVFLDLIIGEERGLMFAAEALAERPLTTIVLMTALPVSHDQVTAAIAEGARDFLSKPIDRGALESVLIRVEDDLVHEEEKPTEDSSYA